MYLGKLQCIKSSCDKWEFLQFVKGHSLTVPCTGPLHNPNGRQIACRYGCARRLWNSLSISSHTAICVNMGKHSHEIKEPMPTSFQCHLPVPTLTMTWVVVVWADVVLPWFTMGEYLVVGRYLSAGLSTHWSGGCFIYHLRNTTRSREILLVILIELTWKTGCYWKSIINIEIPVKIYMYNEKHCACWWAVMVMHY